MIGSDLHRVVSRSRRHVLIGAGGAAVWLGGLVKPALAAALVGDKAAQISAANFKSAVGQLFYVDDGGSPKPALKLVKVVEMTRGKRPKGLRDPFSLIFANPDDAELAPQTYDVLCPVLGWMPMFLSPISPNASKYEAAFN